MDRTLTQRGSSQSASAQTSPGEASAARSKNCRRVILGTQTFIPSWTTMAAQTLNRKHDPWQNALLFPPFS
jgi:hypothetical protein